MTPRALQKSSLPLPWHPMPPPIPLRRSSPLRDNNEGLRLIKGTLTALAICVPFWLFVAMAVERWLTG